MRIVSRVSGKDDAWELEVKENSCKVKPAARDVGTIVEVRDLFHLTPNRLKFLKSERSETTAVIDLVNRLAIANHKIRFKMISNGKVVMDLPSQIEPLIQDISKIKTILGEDFINNAVKVNYSSQDLKVYGYASLPTYRHSSFGFSQYLYVNNRFVKDKLLSIAVKLAYRNLTHDNVYPAVLLFIDIKPELVDVNVHPTKAEVRFSDEGLLKSMVIRAIREAIAGEGVRTSNIFSETTTKYLDENREKVEERQKELSRNHDSFNIESMMARHKEMFATFKKPSNQTTLGMFEKSEAPSRNFQTYTNPSIENKEISKKEERFQSSNSKLGQAKCQIALTYIVAENEEGLVIVDQHAAHERLVLERMKPQMKEGKVSSQILMMPEVVHLGDVLTDKLVEKAEAVKKYGIGIERHGIKEVTVRTVPAVLGLFDIKGLVYHLAEHIHFFDDEEMVEERIEEVLGNIACHASIRAGRKLTIEEMNAILRQMETTAFSSQCNHGRPTFTKLSLKQLDNIFERS